MRAVVAPQPGGPEALELVDLPIPEIGDGDVLIEVVAAGLNRADILQRQGFYPPPTGITDVLGLECSGRIVAVGRDVDGFAIGDEVCALLAGGGYAEFVAAPAGQVVHIPAGVGLTTAAGVMETACTVWSNLVMVAGLRAGQRVLVHGGSSGIGTIAIQVAKALGAQVFTTVGSPEKAEAVMALGADVVTNYRTDDFAASLRHAGLLADVVLDIIGAKYLSSNIAVLAPEGRIVVIGLQGGLTGELNLGALLAKRGTITATSLRARPAEDKARIVRATAEGLFPHIESGVVKPIIDQTFVVDDVRAAHERLESSAHIGKILLSM